MEDKLFITIMTGKPINKEEVTIFILCEEEF